MDELTKAILAAGEELYHDYAWSVGDDCEEQPEPDGVLVSVMRKHLAPLLGSGWKQVRIKALRAEIEMLEREA